MLKYARSRYRDSHPPAGHASPWSYIHGMAGPRRQQCVSTVWASRVTTMRLKCSGSGGRPAGRVKGDRERNDVRELICEMHH